MDDLQNELIHFILELKGLESLSPDESLLESKLIKSFEFVEMLLFIEEKVELKFTDEEIIPENFETVSRIVALVNRKKIHEGI